MIDGRPLHFLNDVEIINDDLIYFTDSSSNWDRRRFLHIGLESNADGRYSLILSTFAYFNYFQTLERCTIDWRRASRIEWTVFSKWHSIAS
jgi:hypothetical protein